MAGFIAEIFRYLPYATFPLPTLICVVCTGLTAVYFVILLNRTCFGKLDNDTAYYPQVKFSEQVPALVLAATIFFLEFSLLG